MNPLDSFTVERLEELADYESWPKASHSEMQELAKIALAAKLAKPIYWEIAGQLFSTKEEALKPGYRGTPEPLYEEPALNYPEIPEGWVLVPKELTAEMAEAAREAHEGEAYLPYSIYRAMLAAAPKPEGA